MDIDEKQPRFRRKHSKRDKEHLKQKTEISELR
jgi:hypothetical protein